MNPRHVGCAAFVCLLMWALVAQGDGEREKGDESIAPLRAPVPTAQEAGLLEAGDVVIRPLKPTDADGFGVLTMGVVKARPEAVWRVMRDCEQQEEFVPRVTSSIVRDRTEDSHTCELKFDLPRPLSDSNTKTQQSVRRLPDGGFQRHWRLAPGDWSYSRNDGSWTVHPYNGGSHSLLISRMDVKLKSKVPRWLQRAAQSRQAPATFEAIRKRVREGLQRLETGGSKR